MMMSIRLIANSANSIVKCGLCSRYVLIRHFSRNPKKPGVREKLDISTRELKKFKLKKLCELDKDDVGSNVIKVTQLWKPFAFTLSVVGLSFGSAAIIEYERLGRKLRSKSDRLREWVRKHPSFQDTYRTWITMTPSERIFWCMCAFNFLVLIALRTRTRQLMYFFTTQPLKKPLYLPMVLAIFGHASFLHLLCNMYGLHSILLPMRSFLGDEQMWALFLSAGVFSSFISVAVKASRRTMVPSLGASGAILGMLGAFCIIQPESRLGIAFVNDFSFPAKYGLIGIILIDSLGLFMGWRFIDHAAHLGGTFFGVWYMKFGQDLLWRYRRKLTVKWRDLKRKF
ncbi:rhomboid family intramembrane serine protease rho-7 [Brevipalpus obovatus]|uniref:rhomboid family intramembrane serine protease rho-7 n=1 Tax=Brevipalpus obovatus TaxID=246614 RepID=UPI003D9E149D